VEVEINGSMRHFEAPENSKAIFILRNEPGLLGVKMGCGEGQCGACVVLVDGVPTTTCDLPVWALKDKVVTTVEGIGFLESPHPVQTAFLEEQAGQCGYCLSGILMTAVALYERDPSPTEIEVRAALDMHLCRCGTHSRIVNAVMRSFAISGCHD
jgi:nicotinate dehydrogenase subunit A